VESWQQEGTIGFFLPEAEAGWRTDRRRHDLPTLRVDRFRITLSKSEERQLLVEVHNLLDLPIMLQTPMPDGSEPLHITIIWRAGNIQLHLDGQPVALIEFPDVEKARRMTNN
jgi:hypothetical protein